MLWGMRRGKCTGRRSVKTSVASIGAHAKGQRWIADGSGCLNRISASLRGLPPGLGTALVRLS